MYYFTDKELDDLLMEDVPFSDITTSFLRLENKPAKIQIATRNHTVVSCTEEVMKLFNKTGIQTTLFTPSGEQLEKGVKFLEGEGLTRSIYAVMRVTGNLLGYASGIATRTRQLVDMAQMVNPAVVIATTRKMTPYTRKAALKAVRSGGGTCHRLGLSDSILISEHHYRFLGGIEGLKKRIAEQSGHAGSKNLTVEVKTPEDALSLADSGIDLLQLDHFTPEAIKKLKKELEKRGRIIKVAAAGHITLLNIKDYANSGADILITSWPYFGEPADLSITVQPVFDQY